ncbi:MAG: MotA/TolQ/ExbB proton channel family protein [Planctomycetales bacterium]
MEARRQNWKILAMALVALALLGYPNFSWSQTNSTSPVVEPSSEKGELEAPQGFFGIVFSGGVSGFLIVMVLLALSIGTVALVIEHVLSIRAKIVMPPGLAENAQQQLLAGNVAAAEAVCKQRPSFLSFVLQAGIAEVDGGWTAVEKSMEDAAAEQSARLFRKIEYLSVIANIAPMIGLLGTVVGMIFAFQEVAASQGNARAADLATGIYQALVTTVGGLLVAIPALAAFAVFRNRVDQLVAEGSYMAQHVFAPLKRQRGGRRNKSGGSQSPAPPPPPTGSD